MLIWGTANPEGESDSHEGYLFTRSDLKHCIDSGHLVGKPVKIEHKGVAVGKVVSAWQSNTGSLDCILDIDVNQFEGSVISKFVQDGVCRELSLGYVVNMQNSNGVRKPVHKEITEISIVKKGARDKCYIYGFNC